MIISAEATSSISLADLPCPITSQLLDKSTPEITFAGDLNLLARETTALFCSAQCPGAAILRTFDRMTQIPDAGQIVLGGFHSPMEQDCLRILLRGRQPIILVLARALTNLRLASELVPAYRDGRLLCLSPFGPQQTRVTAALAAQRNRFAAAVASQVLVASAAPGSRTAGLLVEIRANGKTVEVLSEIDSTAQ
jgi:predicted Rossmann fold nucleotide-binding protein DprA/Smf involved in DNA uptake